MILLKWYKQFKYFENVVVTTQGIHKILGESPYIPTVTNGNIFHRYNIYIRDKYTMA